MDKGLLAPRRPQGVPWVLANGEKKHIQTQGTTCHANPAHAMGLGLLCGDFYHGAGMKSFLTLQSVDAVLDMLEAFPLLPAETVPLDMAVGRYLAEDFHAPEDLPGFDRSTVDGYAVSARDVFGAQECSPALLECIGDCPMGAAAGLALREGQTARILTGGMLPRGADAVVMVEYSRPVSHDTVEIVRSLAPGDNVLMHDEDAARGRVAVAAGRVLRPQEIGFLAALGQEQVTVRRCPRVGIISTGDEIVPIGETPPPGKVRDVNSHSLAALCRRAGAQVVCGDLVRDDRERLAHSVRHALDVADIVLVSGGSSAGMRDYTVEIFQSMDASRLLVHGVSISPGKPFILARAGGKCLMGLPGHVSGALVCAQVFVAPLIRHMQGAQTPIAPQVRARLTRAVASTQGRRDYIRVRLAQGAQGWEAVPLLGPSGLVCGLVQADALVVCPENSEGLYAGQEVTALLLC